MYELVMKIACQAIRSKPQRKIGSDTTDRQVSLFPRNRSELSISWQI